MIRLLMRLTFLLAISIVLSACNLSEIPAGEPTVPSQIEPTQIIPTIGVTTSPPTRTPFGQLPPNVASTSQIVLTPLVPNGNSAFPTAQIPVLTTGERAAVTIPANGATVSNPITISGTISDIPDNRFTLQLVDTTGNVLTSQAMNITAAIGVRQASWSAAMNVGTYTGAAQIRIVTADSRAATLATANVTVQTGVTINSGGGSSVSGTSIGSIDSPVSGGVTTGDPILVSGRAGNFPEMSFTLALYANGVMLNSQTITLTGAAGFIVPWSATMGTGGYRGTAELRAFVPRNGAEVEIARVTFTAN